MASAKGATFANDVIGLIMNAVAIANIAQNNATTPATSMVFTLHTTAAGATSLTSGTQATSEVSYTGFATRPTLLRQTAAGGFTAPSGGVVSPQANVDFPASTGGTGGTCGQASIGTTPSPTATPTNVGTTNKILYWGDVTPAIVVANGVTPRLTTATTIAEV